MYAEMKRYHEEFLKIFEDVSEVAGSNSDKIIKERQYRLGYGQFISELASLNALEKEQLLAMVEKVMDKIWILTAQEDKTKTVEEFIDCIFRLTKSLREKSTTFFASVKEDMKLRIMERATGLIARTVGPRPSLSVKSRFGLMDLKDIL
jgi:dimeric dUTPase (all-alpha-NTP-PPase superfamily)